MAFKSVCCISDKDSSHTPGEEQVLFTLQFIARAAQNTYKRCVYKMQNLLRLMQVVLQVTTTFKWLQYNLRAELLFSRSGLKSSQRNFIKGIKVAFVK